MGQVRELFGQVGCFHASRRRRPWVRPCGCAVIKGVAGAILWKLVQDLVLLQRRLEEYGSPVRIEKTGRGRFRLITSASFTLEQVDR